jgi:hypothetical protein
MSTYMIPNYNNFDVTDYIFLSSITNIIFNIENNILATKYCYDKKNGILIVFYIFLSQIFLLDLGYP